MKSLARYGLAVVPAAMLLLAGFVANRDEPRILGLPFLLAWITFWVLMTPVFLFSADRFREKT